MADIEQVERLKHSVEEWNAWRQEHPKIRPDLSGADLSRSQLSSADLSSADLTKAKLIRADLSHADFSHADLKHAKIRGANLSGIRPIRGYSGKTYFPGANLSGADLCFALQLQIFVGILS